MVEALVLLKDKIPGILSIAVGETFTTERAAGYTHVLTIRLDSRQRLTEYDQHPGEWSTHTSHVLPCCTWDCMAPLPQLIKPS